MKKYIIAAFMLLTITTNHMRNNMQADEFISLNVDISGAVREVFQFEDRMDNLKIGLQKLKNATPQ